jgi:hypothetical protein
MHEGWTYNFSKLVVFAYFDSVINQLHYLKIAKKPRLLEAVSNLQARPIDEPVIF